MNETNLTETTLQNQIRCALSDHGIVIRQNTGFFKTSDNRTVKCGITGLSDLLFIGRNGNVHFIEVKTTKGRATPEQLNFIQLMNSMGIKSGIARSVEEALEIING
jgi:hypothetical protein